MKHTISHKTYDLALDHDYGKGPLFLYNPGATSFVELMCFAQWIASMNGHRIKVTGYRGSVYFAKVQ